MGVLWELMVCRALLQVTVLKCVLLLWESFFGTYIRAAITRWCCYTPISLFLGIRTLSVSGEVVLVRVGFTVPL